MVTSVANLSADVRRDPCTTPSDPAAVDALAATGRSFAAPRAGDGPSRGSGRPAPAAEEIRGRRLGTEPSEPETPVSRPDLGPAVASRGLVDASDRAGDTVIAFLQGAAGARRLVAAVEDRPPGAPAVTTHSGWQNNPRPKIKWTGASDLWGSPTYRLILGGLDIGRGTSTFFRPAGDLPDGVYLYRVIATDRRGQARQSRDRNLRVDTTQPTIFNIAPPVRVGTQVLLSLVDAARPAGGVSRPGSGIVLAKINFGDGSPPVVERRRSAPSDRHPARLRAPRTLQGERAGGRQGGQFGPQAVRGEGGAPDFGAGSGPNCGGLGRGEGLAWRHSSVVNRPHGSALRPRVHTLSLTRRR